MCIHSTNITLALFILTTHFITHSFPYASAVICNTLPTGTQSVCKRHLLLYCMTDSFQAPPKTDTCKAWLLGLYHYITRYTVYHYQCLQKPEWASPGQSMAAGSISPHHQVHCVSLPVPAQAWMSPPPPLPKHGCWVYIITSPGTLCRILYRGH